MPDGPAGSDVIRIERLTKHYGSVSALAGVDLRVGTGEIFGFLGPNGAGKTTTLRILMGLLRASGGRATVFGRDSWRESTAIRRQVGYLPGDVHLYEWMRGTTFLQFCNRGRGGGSEAEIARLKDRFGLDARRHIRDYSRGMKQKLGLIQALMHRPRLLILDEPTTALDPLVRQTLYEELRGAVGRGQTVLFSSHTLSEVELLCDRVAIIRGGRVIEDSTVADLQGRALRRVEFRLRGGSVQSLTLPEGLSGGVGTDGVWSGSWQGPVNRLMSWLAGLDLSDVQIGVASLEDLFAAYYQEPAASVATDRGAMQ